MYVKLDIKPLVKLDPQPIFIMSHSELLNTHVVYEHQVFRSTAEPPISLFIGVTRMAELFQFSDARRNSEWLRYVTPDRPLITIVHATGDYNQCSNYRRKLVIEKKPFANLRGFDASMSMRVRCLEDGKIYDTVTDAARNYDASISAVSNHLNGKPGFKSVKGHTFERIPRDEQPTTLEIKP
jgi:hypothetical protein